MKKFGKAMAALAAAAALAGCQVQQPTGPTIAVMPGNGKTLTQFQQDDYACRNFAQGQLNPNAGQSATNRAVGTAAVGTVLGTAAGALIGAAAGNAGMGAGIGAGVGLAGSSAYAGSQANQAGMSLQDQYNIAYAQCMKTKGNSVP